MKMTRIAMILMVLVLTNCSRRTTNLADYLGSPDPFYDNTDDTQNVEPVQNNNQASNEDDSSEDNDQSSNSSQTTNNTSNSSSSTSSSSSSTNATQASTTQTSAQTTTQSAPAAPVAVVKRPIYRSVHTYYGNRYWTAAWSNIVAAATYYGFAYEGVGFELATYATNDCGLPIYACQNPTIGMYFLYHNESCGGSPNVKAEWLGYACNPNGSTPTYAVYGMRHDNGWLFYTSSLEEVNYAQRYGFYVIGAYHAPK